MYFSSIMPNVFPILINWTSQFLILGLLGDIFIFFFQILRETYVSKHWKT